MLVVLTEYIPYRLAEAHNLPLSEALYVLHEALIGFMAVHKFENYVEITDELIGFTPSGRTKVWLNANFAANYAIRKPERMAADFAARRMISELFQVVEGHTVGKSFPSYFKAGWNPTNFVEAINIVKDYAAESGTVIARRVTLPTHQRIAAPVTTTTTTTTTETHTLQAEPTRTIQM